MIRETIAFESFILSFEDLYYSLQLSFLLLMHLHNFQISFYFLSLDIDKNVDMIFEKFIIKEVQSN